MDIPKLFRDKADSNNYMKQITLFVKIPAACVLMLSWFLLSCTNIETENDGTKVIRFWQFIASEEYLDPVITKFEKDNPGIKVEMQQLTYDNGFEKIVTSIAAGTQPDICEIGSTWLARFAYEGAIRNVDTLMNELADSLILPDMVKYNSHYFGIPWMLGTRVLFYNKEMIANVQSDSTGAPATWDELIQISRKIHDPQNGIYGFGMAAGENYSPWQKFLPVLWQFNGDIADSLWQNCLLNSPQAVNALDYYYRFKDVSLIDRQGQLDQLFTQGKMAFNISGSWNLALIPKNNPQLKYGISFIPKLSAHERISASIAGGEVLIFMRSSKVFEESMILAKYLLQLENILPIIERQKNIIPAVKSAIDHPYYKKNTKERLFFEQLLSSRPLPVHPYWTEIQEHFTQAIERVILNDENTQDVLKETTININQILNR